MMYYFLLLFFSLVLACQNQNNSSIAGQVQEEMDGKTLYKKHCSACHGNKGNLGIAEATDLQTSVMTPTEIIEIISEGKNNMPPMKEKINGTEIESIANYILLFRNINNEN